VIALRTLARDDVPLLFAILDANRGTAPPYSRAAIEGYLYDEERGVGARTRVAIDDDGTVVGSVSWIVGGEASFLAPLVAARRDVAAALIDAGLAEVIALGAAWTRVSSGTSPAPRTDAIVDAGFAPVFDFVDVVRPTARVDVPDVAGIQLVPAHDVDRDRLLALYNETFEGIPNALPMTRSGLDAQLADPGLFAAGTGVAVDGDGTLAGFVLALDDRTSAGHFAHVDSVGVRETARGRGIGRALLLRMIDAAAAAGIPEAYAAIASTNIASLGLHDRLGFVERWRRRVWERPLR
jgi:phosphinothricin acetyltransferase